MDFDDDPDLRRAMVLSLQESTHDRDIDNEDEELRRAIELSKLEAQKSQIRAFYDVEPLAMSSSTLPKSASSTEQVARSDNTKSFLLERAQMEKERLARFRMATCLPEESIDESKGKRKRDEDDEEGNAPAKKQTSKPGSSKGSELFWDAETRPTATLGAEPRKDGKKTFSLDDVVGKDISFAIISSYVTDLVWIRQKFECGVPVILVGQPESDGKARVENLSPDWIKTAPFLRGGHGCMHMKAAWIQDFQLLPTPCVYDKKATTHFQYVMKRVLDSVNVRPALAAMLKGHPSLPIKTTEEICTRWDWSKVQVHLVPSIAGRHESWPNVNLTGHPRLMKSILDLGLRTGIDPNAKSLQLEYQGSSIGQYTTQWLNEFFWSCRGESAAAWLDEPKSKRQKLPYPEPESMKILFPSKETVQGSLGGVEGAGTIICKRKQWEAAKFPRHLFFDSKSRAGPTLMHTKMILATFSDGPSSSKACASVTSNAKRAPPKPSTSSATSKAQARPGTSNGNGKQKEIPEISDDESVTESETEPESDEDIPGPSAVGWAYMGSHNFTPAAWGTLSGSSSCPVLNIRNYELGIVFPLKTQADVETVACWERPAEGYAGTGKEPWIREEGVYFWGGGMGMGMK
ncbi:hypothetical protein V5O48_014189 [Marasmius crinis-equi]|uniref:Tyrosyl-DNA phosphodiesterase 1 n=1 Tax=Marasmius crinis-equi TaxID=585013 RepID=A0ABR3EY09_9AGAR